MDLANMRENGVRHLMVSCLECNHSAEVNVDRFPGYLFVPTMARRFRCSRCGSRKIESRPAWHLQEKHSVSR